MKKLLLSALTVFAFLIVSVFANKAYSQPGLVQQPAQGSTGSQQSPQAHSGPTNERNESGGERKANPIVEQPTGHQGGQRAPTNARPTGGQQGSGQSPQTNSGQLNQQPGTATRPVTNQGKGLQQGTVQPGAGASQGQGTGNKNKTTINQSQPGGAGQKGPSQLNQGGQLSQKSNSGSSNQRNPGAERQANPTTQQPAGNPGSERVPANQRQTGGQVASSGSTNSPYKPTPTGQTNTATLNQPHQGTTSPQRTVQGQNTGGGYKPAVKSKSPPPQGPASAPKPAVHKN